jgi:hypothetical protein
VLPANIKAARKKVAGDKHSLSVTKKLKVFFIDDSSSKDIE